MFVVTNWALYRQKKWLEVCLEQPIRCGRVLRKYKMDVRYLGWGHQPNALPLQKFAKNAPSQFIRIESGFVGFIGHPAKKAVPVSLIKDMQGMYYDSRTPSEFENLMHKPCTDELIARAIKLRHLFIKHGITQYSCYPSAQSHLLPRHRWIMDAPYVLLIDQAAGDQTIAGAQASEASFLHMVCAAKQRYPHACIIVLGVLDKHLRPHKNSVLSGLKHHPDLSSATWLNETYHPHALLRHAQAVYTVSSQLGFEALLLDKPVYCFGLPFYAGWGLTQDTLTIPRRKPSTLNQLIAAALIVYPIYYHPVLKRQATPEEIFELIHQQNLKPRTSSKLYAFDFSLRKRPFIPAFATKIADQVVFIKHPPKKLRPTENLLIWGYQYPEYEDAIRVEDGFIRSSGLGSNFSYPASLVFDDLSLYFNAYKPSRFLKLCNTLNLQPSDEQRGEQIMRLLRQHDVSKYNLQQRGTFVRQSSLQRVVLVVGQVDNDASILKGSPYIKSNEALLQAVRQDEPDVYILYKPHSDVLAGNRIGQVTDECMRKCVDEVMVECQLSTLYPHIDALHTMTSLSGLEALIRGVRVITWGQPFYSGWGLTEDRHPPVREQEMNLAQLVYVAFVEYAYYIVWSTRLWITLEVLIEQLAHSKTYAYMQPSRIGRFFLRYRNLLGMLRPNWRR